MKIIIELDKGKVTTSSDVPAPIDKIMPVIFTAQLAMMNTIMEKAKADKLSDEDLETLKGDMYDSYNIGASKVLEHFAPEIELHPDLTVEAMKAAEDKYMYNSLNRKDRRDVDKKLKKKEKQVK